MDVSLDPDKGSFCTVGPHFFTFGEPGPLKVNIGQLSKEELAQLMYNLKRGVLVADDKKELDLLVQPNYSTPQEVPIQEATVLPPVGEDAIEEDLKVLRELLSGNVNTVMRTAGDFRPARLRKLLELEEGGKARKGLISFLKSFVDSHVDSVRKAIGSKDLEPIDVLELRKLSTQLTDIVESEQEIVLLEKAK